MIELEEGLGNLAIINGSGVYLGDHKNRYGENSEYQITTDIKEVYRNLDERMRDFYIVRYKKLNVANICPRRYSQISFEYTPNFESMVHNSYGDPSIKNYSYFSEPKTFNGFVDNIKKIIKAIAICFNIDDKKTIINDIDFLTLLPDNNRIELTQKRYKLKDKIYGFEPIDRYGNSDWSPSDQQSRAKNISKKLNTNVHGNFLRPEDKVYKSQLQDRLKKYIDSKLPDLSIFKKMDNIKTIINDIKRFKIKDIVYSVNSYDPYNINFEDLINGKDVYIKYRSDAYYTKLDAPGKILVKIKLEDNKLSTDGIYGTYQVYVDRSLGKTETKIKPINEFTFMPKKTDESIEKNGDILTEGVQDLRKYFPMLDDATFNKALSLDPTYKGGDKVGSFTTWILHLIYNNLKNIENEKKWNELMAKYPDGINPKTGQPFNKFEKLPEIMDEDLYKIPESINEYLRFQKYLNKIDTYKSLPDLDQAIDEVKNAHLTEIERVDKIMKIVKEAEKVGLEKVYEDSKWYVGVPTTKESSCCFSQVSSWCTTSSSGGYYEGYLKNYGGKYFINVNKDTGAIYQFHFESGQTMDAHDKSIDVADIMGDDLKIMKFYMEYIVENVDIHNNSSYDILDLIKKDIAWYNCIKDNKELKSRVDNLIEEYLTENNIFDLPSSIYEIISSNKNLFQKYNSLYKSKELKNSENDYILKNLFNNHYANYGFIKLIEKYDNVYEEFCEYFKTHTAEIFAHTFDENPEIYRILKLNELFNNYFKKEAITRLTGDEGNLLLNNSSYVLRFADKNFLKYCEENDLMNYFYDFVKTHPDKFFNEIFCYLYYIDEDTAINLAKYKEIRTILRGEIDNADKYELNRIRLNMIEEFFGSDFIFDKLFKNPNFKLDNDTLLRGTKILKRLSGMLDDDNVLLSTANSLLGWYDKGRHIVKVGDKFIFTGAYFDSFYDYSYHRECVSKEFYSETLQNGNVNFDYWNDYNYSIEDLFSSLPSETIKWFDENLKENGYSYNFKQYSNAIKHNQDDDEILEKLNYEDLLDWLRRCRDGASQRSAEDEAFNDIKNATEEYVYGDLDYGYQIEGGYPGIVYKKDTLISIIRNCFDNYVNERLDPEDIMEDFEAIIVNYNNDEKLSISEPYNGWDGYSYFDENFDTMIRDSYGEDFTFPKVDLEKTEDDITESFFSLYKNRL